MSWLKGLLEEPDSKYQEKFDSVLACTDYNMTGEVCPFYMYGKCKFNGAYDSSPETLICDKTPDDPTFMLDRLGVITVNQWEKIQETRKSRDYSLWLNAYNHYKFQEKERLLIEQKELIVQAGYVSNRDFKKLTKPNGIGVTEKEPKSFRGRVLSKFKDPTCVSIPIDRFEPVVLIPSLDEDEDYWYVDVLTRYSSFSGMYSEEYEIFLEMLGPIFRQHEGKKLLLEWSCWYTGGSYYEPYDCSYGVDEIKLIKVLT